MLDYLKDLDESLFLYLNGLHNDLFDFLMHWITYQQTWYPFYALIIFWMIWKFKINALFPIITIIIAITLSDQFPSGFMKPFFERLRPCHEPTIGYLVHVVDGCGGQFGVASAHASNSFALAILLYLLLKPYIKYASMFFVWATIVSYSRIYVGVHYPGDVIAGGLVGVFIGWTLFIVYSKIPEKYRLSG